ncbi:hypothetical protein [Streptomyces sp. NBC_01262]|nr:hypothetical protein [Streptomyces sp. NBC_01262]
MSRNTEPTRLVAQNWLITPGAAPHPKADRDPHILLRFNRNIEPAKAR